MTTAPVRRPFLRSLALLGAAATLSPLAGIRRAQAADALQPGEDAALVVVDVQNCFLPNGTLPVKEGDAIIPIINRLGRAFRNIVITQDWHTPGHASFASAHPGKKPFETIDLPYGKQVLWPDHCIQGTKDAELGPGLDLPGAQLIIRKGYHDEVDSYSAMEEADRKTPTGLNGYLKERGIRSLYVTGLATDFCVGWTALDARRMGFEVAVIEDACRAIDLNGSLAAAWAKMEEAGVKRMQSSQFRTA